MAQSARVLHHWPVGEPEDQIDTTVTTVSRRIQAAEVDAVDHTERTILVRTGPGLFDREVRIRSHAVACFVAAVLGVAIGVVTILWFDNAWTWLDPCRDTPPGLTCATPAKWFRLPQFAVACAGLISGSAISIYLLRFAFTGQIWRNSRRMAVVHGVIVMVWLFIWALGSFAR